LGSDIAPFRRKGFGSGGVNPPAADKLFEERATGSWNLAAGVETPEKGAPERANLTFYGFINLEP